MPSNFSTFRQCQMESRPPIRPENEDIARSTTWNPLTSTNHDESSGGELELST